MSPTGSSTTRSLMTRRIWTSLKLRILSKICPTTSRFYLLIVVFDSRLALGSRICCNCRGKGQHKWRNMFWWSPEHGPVKGASQHGARDRHHAQWCICASLMCFTWEADPAIVHEEKPVDTNKTGDKHMTTQIVPTDVSRTVPIYESYTLHRAIFAWMAVILQGTLWRGFHFLEWITTHCSRLL